MTTFINLTPHPTRLRRDAANTAAEPLDDDIVVEPDPNGPARVSAEPGPAEGNLNGVALYGATQFGQVTGLPEPRAGTIYIVSALVAGRLSGRLDVVAPGTGPRDEAVRTANGHIFAVTRLIRAC